ncbi:MAG: hypothetical protein IKH27_06265 [Oscillospiraceae bacterium]|nr:hypothetical protein [Oscillospiraceae bacterium]
MDDVKSILLCLDVLERLKGQIFNRSAVSYIEDAVRLTRQWLNDQAEIADAMYDLLDSEAQSFTLFQEAETDARQIAVWNCIIDAAAYICRRAYEAQGAKYVPEPVGLVGADTLEHMKHTYEGLCNGSI